MSGNSADRRRERRTVGRIIAALNMSIRTGNPGPWYESNLLWGTLGLGVGIVLSVVAAMQKDLRWLLWIAWPCLLLFVWALARPLPSKAMRHGCRAFLWIGVALGLFHLGNFLGPVPPQGKPPLEARLVVDSLHPADTQFHIEITNVSPATAEEIGISIRTARAGMFDLMPLGTRTLAPQKSLEIPGLMFSDFANSRNVSIAATFIYNPRRPQTTPTQMTIRFDFSVSQGEITGMVFDPKISQESGNALAGDQAKSLLDTFAEPIGSISFVLLEKTKSITLQLISDL